MQQKTKAAGWQWLIAGAALMGSVTPTWSAPQSVVVQVPSGMDSSPFDTPRTLNVPSGYKIAVWSRVSGARFMAFAPNGDLLVSEPGQGKVKLLRPAVGGGAPQQFDFVTGLTNPHDIVFHTINGTTYIYITESTRINRYTYTSGDTTAKNRETLISGLASASSPELGGQYAHQLKNIALGPDHKLYVSVGSATNSSPSDETSSPPRGAIYQYNADGSGFRVFARGLRNAEGLAFLPGTNNLWAAVNNRDNIKYPYDDSNGWYGQTKTEYVDDHPPEEFTHVQDGANYGWPYANPNPTKGLDSMPFDPDYDNNRDWSVFPQSTFTKIDKGIQAHSAPLGLTFTQGTGAETTLGAGALIAFHGSWDRSVPTGYKIAFFPWQSSKPGAQVDLVYGWLTDSNSVWGRPVDTAISTNGDIFISDDKSGTIYRLYLPPIVTPTVGITAPANNTIVNSAFKFIGNAGDTGNGVSGVRVSLDRATGTGYTSQFANRDATLSTVSGGVTWQLAPGSLPDGRYRVTATARDASGNKAVATALFSLDLLPPSVSIQTPTAGKRKSKAFTATGTAGDVGTSVSSVVMKLTRTSGKSPTVVLQKSATLSGPSGSVQWSLAIPALSAGSYTMQVTAQDASHHAQAQSVAFTVKASSTR